MPKMRAKMKVTSVNRLEHGAEVLKMEAVGKSDGYGEDGVDENNTFARFTAAGSVELYVANPDLVGEFTPGQHFYIDFTEA